MVYIQTRMLVLLVLLFSGVAVPVYADHGDQVMPVSMPELHTNACALDRDLMLGSRGADVACLQHTLISEGLLTTSATGYFGNLTKAAVEAWQRTQGVPVTGYFGPLSRARLTNTSPAPEMTSMHAHEPIDVRAWQQEPRVSVVATADSLSGVNLHVVAEHFRFAPEHVNTAPVEGEGHAHVYIDGVKWGRLYGEWLHLPKETFKTAGEHQIRVTLNANDHSDLALNGVVVATSTKVVVQ